MSDAQKAPEAAQRSSKTGALLFGVVVAAVLAAVFYFVVKPMLAERRTAERVDIRNVVNKVVGEALMRPPTGVPPFLLRPNYDGGDKLKTNSLGMRSRELAKEKKLPRILVLGDSFTFGYGLMEGEPFTHVMQKKLEGVAEVANAAVSGFEIQDTRAQFERVVDAVKPDWVVLTFVMNDLNDSFTFEEQGNYVRPPKLEELSEGYFAGNTNLIRLVHNSTLSPVEKDKFLARFANDNDYIPLGVGHFAASRWRKYASELKHIVDGAKKYNARVMMFSFNEIGTAAHGRLLRACSENGISFFCIENELNIGKPEFNLGWDPHPNALANEKFAARILGALVGLKAFDIPGVPAVAAIESIPRYESGWELNTAAYAVTHTHESIVFIKDKFENVNQIVAGFEDPNGLLGARAVVLLGSARPFYKLRITADLEGSAAAEKERKLELRFGGADAPVPFTVKAGGGMTDITIPEEAKELCREGAPQRMLELDLRDPEVANAPQKERPAKLGVRIRRIEIY